MTFVFIRKAHKARFYPSMDKIANISTGALETIVNNDAATSIPSLLIDRARTGSRRNNRQDGFHLAVVIECGGMRGIAAGGVLKVLAEAKLLDSFDTFHGSSAGACAAAFFFTKQFEEGIKIFSHDICNRKVINPLRFFYQPCMVDTDYIVDEVFAIKRRLNVEKIISEPGVLNIITTSVSDGFPKIHREFSSAAQVYLALKATLRVPGPFEQGIEINGSRHLDGGIAAPLPVFSAIASGATHILIVGTQREGDYELSRTGVYLERAVLRLLYGKQLEQAYIDGDRQRSISINRDATRTDVLVRPRAATYCSWATIEASTLCKVEGEAESVARAYVQAVGRM
jgi:predicted patatin/cPLA2 family phospholipase